MTKFIHFAKVAFIALCCLFFITCSTNRQFAGSDIISIKSEMKDKAALLKEPLRSTILLTLIDKEKGKIIKGSSMLLINNIQFLPDSIASYSIKLFPGKYKIEGASIGYKNKILKFNAEKEYNYKIDIKLKPDMVTRN